MAEHRASVLVVDADPTLAGRLQTALEREGVRVRYANSGPDLIEPTVADLASIVVLSEQHGALAEFMARVRIVAPLTQVILLLDPVGDPARALARVREWGLHGCYRRGDDITHLATAILAALGTHEQLSQLHATERIKSELLADVSHEFRTPLNVILGYLDLLTDGAFGPLPTDAVAVHQKLVGNATFLLDMVEEFLDVARVESAASPRRHDAFDLRPLLHDLSESFTLLVHERPVVFRTQVPTDLPPTHGDPAKLRVIIQNLLANAAKFTREGFIELSAHAGPDGWVVVRVTDTGPGIPDDQREKIFDLFHQAGSASDRAKGIGLGLALARRFASALGGHLGVESTVGVGTTFTLRLPGARRIAAA